MRFIFSAMVLGALCFASCSADSTSTSSLDGLPTTESGCMYDMHMDATGDACKVGDQVVFHVIQRFDDSIVYNSYEKAEPAKLVVPDPTLYQGQPSPVVEMLALMSIGDSATVYIDLDSLPQRPPGLESRKHLIYDLKVLNTNNLKDEENKIATKVADVLAAYNGGTLENVKTTASGLKYMMMEEGTGADAEAGKGVSVQYYGTLTDGTMFDNSFSRGEPIAFPLGQGRVIKGWDEGIDLLKVGGKAVLFIPYELGYGEAGSPPKIPGKSELVFYVELEDVQQ